MKPKESAGSRKSGGGDRAVSPATLPPARRDTVDFVHPGHEALTSQFYGQGNSAERRRMISDVLYATRRHHYNSGS